MATRHKDMLGWPTQPDSSSVYFASYANYATNDHWKGDVLVFEDTSSKEELHGRTSIPEDFVGTPKLRIEWTTTATTGDWEIDFEYRCVGGDDQESLDQSTAQESVNQADTAPSAAHERQVVEIALTGTNFAAGDEMEWRLGRDGADAGDTLAADVLVFEVEFVYSDA